jgi:hypothetical protein
LHDLSGPLYWKGISVGLCSCLAAVPMFRPVSHRWLLVAAVAALVLCAHEALGVATARASCGDYVSVGGSHGQPDMAPHDAPRPSPHVDESGLPGSLTHVRPALPCSRCPAAPGKSPCQGPWCSNSPAPLPAPVTAGGAEPDGWACWWQEAGAPAPDMIRRGPNDSCFIRIHHVDPIFHPPRPV